MGVFEVSIDVNFIAIIPILIYKYTGTKTETYWLSLWCPRSSVIKASPTSISAHPLLHMWRQMWASAFRLNKERVEKAIVRQGERAVDSQKNSKNS